MVILGIDPSYSNTGVALVDTGSLEITAFTNIKVTKGAVYQLDKAIQYANEICKQIDSFIKLQNITIDCVVIEYPVLRTPSGAYLGMIQPILYNYFTSNGYKYIMLPSQAINSFIGNKEKTKTFIVSTAKETFVCPVKFNHDVASAAFLTLIGQSVINGKYKHSFMTNFPIN